MPKSSISNPLTTEGALAKADVAAAIGLELRRRRKARGLTQAELAAPLTRAFVSAVELGYTVPSLPALLALTGRLGIGLAEFFEGVNFRSTPPYNPAHEHQDASPGHRR